MNQCKSALSGLLPSAVIIVMVMCGFVPPLFADSTSADKASMIRHLLPTVVNIAVKKDESTSTPADAASANGKTTAATASPNIKSYIGSGFVIDPSGLIVTNYHVVQDAFKITVTFSDGSSLPGNMLSASRVADLALVKVGAGHPLPAAHWGNSDELQVGDQVIAAGDPFGIGLSITAGIVSGLNRNLEDSPYDDFIQTDAPINHGNSGGPLFDLQGNVVGVDSDILSPTRGSVGLGFAIPSHNARFVVDRLLKYGWVHPGWIGIKVNQVTPRIADALGMAQPQGSIVSWVIPNGPANNAGLEIGDVVLRYDGRTPSDDRALLRDIVETPVGKKVPLEIRRGAVELTVTVTIESWPRNRWETRDAPSLVQRPKIIVPPDLGLSLAPLTPDEKAKLGVAEGLNGVLVTAVAPDSDAAHQGMAAGDVILRVQNQPVATPEEVRSDIDAARAAKHEFVLMLVLPKVQVEPGPEWMSLQVSTSGS